MLKYHVLAHIFIDAEGKAAEEEINKKGLPGKAMFIFCDVTKEEDVKVSHE